MYEVHNDDRKTIYCDNSAKQKLHLRYITRIFVFNDALISSKIFGEKNLNGKEKSPSLVLSRKW